MQRLLCPTHRYIILCEAKPVYTTDDAEDLLTYLWGCQLQSITHALWRYTVLDYEVPYDVDTNDLCAWLARLPTDDPLPRPWVPLQGDRR
jgi:hypothetical protein